jgi:hypothetical protein
MHVHPTHKSTKHAKHWNQVLQQPLPNTLDYHPELTSLLALLHHVDEVLLLCVAQRLKLLHSVNVHLAASSSSSSSTVGRQGQDKHEA